jgi:hypothetical protein
MGEWFRTPFELKWLATPRRQRHASRFPLNRILARTVLRHTDSSKRFELDLQSPQIAGQVLCLNARQPRAASSNAPRSISQSSLRFRQFLPI